ncbi:MAG: hypothetical protein M1814_002779 [Vezdaea aestivalis]|nr:MAG: hypothetical protein M1814_002779 [Vezdaea aestivalis]
MSASDFKADLQTDPPCHARACAIQGTASVSTAGRCAAKNARALSPPPFVELVDPTNAHSGRLEKGSFSDSILQKAKIPQMNIIEPSVSSSSAENKEIPNNWQRSTLEESRETGSYSEPHPRQSLDPTLFSVTALLVVNCANKLDEVTHQLDLRDDPHRNRPDNYDALVLSADTLVTPLCPPLTQPKLHRAICLFQSEDGTNLYEHPLETIEQWYEIELFLCNYQAKKQSVSIKISRTYTFHRIAGSHATFLVDKAEELSQKNTTSVKGQNFLSSACVDQLCSVPHIAKVVRTDDGTKQLTACQQDRFIKLIVDGSRKLFIIFLLAGQDILQLEKILEKGWNDSTLLPIDGGEVPKDLEVVAREAKFHELARVQWRVDVPSFDEPGEHQDLPPQAIVPIINLKECGQGANSRVYAVQFHPTHQSLAQGNPHFALKELRDRPVGLERNFKSEQNMLNKLRELQNPHIVELLCTWTQKNALGTSVYYMLFRLAEKTLFRMVQERPPSLQKSFVYWLFQQLLGLAGAIHEIHNFEDKNQDSLSARKTGYHHDLNMDNILYFARTEGQEFGTLVISDFGLAKFHGPLSGSGTKARKSTPTYAPPESDSRGQISRPYDMWSLGCIFVELLVWILYGPRAVDRFARERYGPALGFSEDDAFYKTTDSKCDLRPAVKTWSAKIQTHPSCIGGLAEVHTLTRKLLNVDPTTRMTSAQLVEELKQMVEQVKQELEDEEFFLVPQKQSNIDTRSVGSQSRNSSAAHDSPDALDKIMAKPDLDRLVI